MREKRQVRSDKEEGREGGRVRERRSDSEGVRGEREIEKGGQRGGEIESEERRECERGEEEE